MPASRLTRRGVRRVVATHLQPQDSPSHRVRLVLEPGHWEEHDPFLMLAEDWFHPGTFEDHPHRGIETVTYVLDGELAHADNRGGKGVLLPGDAQWMTAGRGIVHREDPLPGKPVHSLQLWINLPAADKLAEPRYQDLRGAEMPVRAEPGAQLRVFSGHSGDAHSATLNHVPVTMVELRLEAGATVSQELRNEDNGFLYLLAGRGHVGVDGTRAQAGQVVWLSRPGEPGPAEVTVHAESALHALLWAGPPLREPVVHYGPFVMNDREQIAEAIADYRAGRF